MVFLHQRGGGEDEYYATKITIRGGQFQGGEGGEIGSVLNGGVGGCKLIT